MSKITEIDSTLGWWREAGVDTIVGDEPRSWLLDAAKRPAKAAVADQAKPVREPMPGELPAFRAWLLKCDAVPVPATDRLDATGDPASGLMILVDMPEPGDREAGALVSGETGRLLDRMLGAIGRDRASTYLAPMSPGRIAGGTIADDAADILASMARHHVGLAAPKMLLLMGEAPTRAFCGVNLNQTRGKQLNINHHGGNVYAIATFHPRFLLQQPKFKAESWKDLQMLIKGMLA